MQASPTSHFSPGASRGHNDSVFTEQFSGRLGAGSRQSRPIPWHKSVHPNDLAGPAEVVSGFGAYTECQTKHGCESWVYVCICVLSLETFINLVRHLHALNVSHVLTQP